MPYLTAAHNRPPTFQGIHSIIPHQHADEQPIHEEFRHSIQDVQPDLHIGLVEKYARFQRVLQAKIVDQSREE